MLYRLRLRVASATPFPMRRLGLLLLCTLVLAAVAATAARAHPTPQIRAEQAREKAVVNQINTIGRNLEGVVQQYDAAQYV